MINSAVSKDYCKDVLPIPQFEATCWFNSLLMCLFYSELMRNFFIKELPMIRKRLSNSLSKSNAIKTQEIFEDLLFNNYKVNNKNNLNFYTNFKPENILLALNEIDKELFYINNDWIKKGFNGSVYLDQVFRFLNVKEKVLYLSINEKLSKYGNYYELPLKNSYVKDVHAAKNNSFVITYEQDVTKLPQQNPYHKFAKINQNNKFVSNHDVEIPHKYFYFKDFKRTELVLIPTDIDIICLDIMDVSNVPHDVLKFKNGTFILDSMMISNFNRNTCGKSHQIAGITCKSKKYLYNGWTNITKDPAKNNSEEDKIIEDLKNDVWRYEDLIISEENTKNYYLSEKKKRFLNPGENKRLNEAINEILTLSKKLEELKEKLSKIEDPKKKPCNLVRFDWNVDDKTFCIDTKKCTYPNTKDDSDICFNVRKGIRSYFYVRDTMKDVDTKSAQYVSKGKTTPQSGIKECPPDKILNHATKRCVSKTGAIGKKLVEQERKQKQPHKSPSSSSSNDKEKEICPPDKILNHATKRCVSKTGAIGKKLVEQERFDKRKSQNKKQKEEDKVCKDNQIFNPATKRCVSRTGVVGKKLLLQKSK